MTGVKRADTAHLNEKDISDYLDRLCSAEAKGAVERHVSSCPECLEALVSAYEAVREFKKEIGNNKGKGGFMKKFNIYLILALISFLLSFIVPQYFAQFLVATTLLGIKWISDAKTTRMLVTIYDAWKRGGEKEASRILKTLEHSPKDRF